MDDLLQPGPGGREGNGREERGRGEGGKGWKLGEAAFKRPFPTLRYRDIKTQSRYEFHPTLSGYSDFYFFYILS